MMFTKKMYYGIIRRSHIIKLNIFYQKDVGLKKFLKILSPQNILVGIKH